MSKQLYNLTGVSGSEEVVLMDNKTIDFSKIWECLDCGEQWADQDKHYMCLFCDGHKIELVCNTQEQFHLLKHPEANC